MPFEYNYTIRGRPVAKKNRHRVRWRNGRPFVGNDRLYLEWADDAVMQLRVQRGSTPTIDRQVNLLARVQVYLAKGQSMDSDNALCGAFDCLQSAGVIANDAQIKMHTMAMNRDRDDPRIEINLSPSMVGG